MKNNKLVVALFVGAISTKQLPNINMIGAAMLDKDIHDLQNTTHEAYVWGDSAINHTEEGNNLQSAYANWTQTDETKKFI